MSESEKCGLRSILPMACRGRAEAFARRLHSRLRSLSGGDDDDAGGSADETSWLASDEGPVVALTQPHVRHQEVYLDFGLLESPPEEDEDAAEEKSELLNEDLLGRTRCQCGKRPNSVEDSDSDGPFYDSEERYHCNGDAECSGVRDLGDPGDLGDPVGESSPPVRCPVEITVNGVVDDEPETNPKVNGVDIDDDDDDDDPEERSPRVRRCSSLKTGKTPPGTPASKKIVRFADALGLDLADVRTFLDEIPKVPTSAYEDLSVESCCDASPKFQTVHLDKILVPLFQQPGGLLNFLDLVRVHQVCLENAVVDDPLLLSVKGFVRVRNLDFHKSVYVRYSLNSWRSFADVQATYVDNSCDGFSDKFAFVLYAHTLSVGQKLEFACRFQCRGCQYWDNNSGKNYCFQCLPATSNAPQGLVTYTQADEWGGASFYYRESRDEDEDEDEEEKEKGEVESLTPSQVQDIIWRTLATKDATSANTHRHTQRSKRDVIVVLIILLFSILFLYLQKAIYFMK